MPINACSINSFTINGKCAQMQVIINTPIKGHVRNIPPIYSMLHRDVDEYDNIPITYEQPYIILTLDMLGETFTEIQENIPLDMGSVVFINNLNIQEFQISVDINDLRVEENEFNFKSFRK